MFPTSPKRKEKNIKYVSRCFLKKKVIRIISTSSRIVFIATEMLPPSSAFPLIVLYHLALHHTHTHTHTHTQKG
jgi:hypothetical protein